MYAYTIVSETPSDSVSGVVTLVSIYMTTRCGQDHPPTPNLKNSNIIQQDELVGCNETVTFPDFLNNITYDMGLTDKREVGELWVSKTI
jgi:hypothetical protein